MTGKEFKEFLNKTLEDDDIVDNIDLSGTWLGPQLEDLVYDREERKDGKTYYFLSC